MSDNTCGSNDLCCIRFTDINGSHVKDDTLFLNIYDYWTGFHNEDRIYFWWSSSLLSKLEWHIRKNWKACLPGINIAFEIINTKDNRFEPRNVLNNHDTEKFFELLVLWKELYEKYYLTLKPRYQHYRHKKVLAKPYRKAIRR